MAILTVVATVGGFLKRLGKSKAVRSIVAGAGLIVAVFIAGKKSKAKQIEIEVLKDGVEHEKDGRESDHYVEGLDNGSAGIGLGGMLGWDGDDEEGEPQPYPPEVPEGDDGEGAV